MTDMNSIGDHGSSSRDSPPVEVAGDTFVVEIERSRETSAVADDAY